MLISDLLSPFSMTASSSSCVLVDNRCLVKMDFSLQTFAMLSLLAWSTQIQKRTHFMAAMLQRKHQIVQTIIQQNPVISLMRAVLLMCLLNATFDCLSESSA